MLCGEGESGPSLLGTQKVIHQIKHSSVTHHSCSCTRERVAAFPKMTSMSYLLPMLYVWLGRKADISMAHGERYTKMQLHKSSALHYRHF